MYLTLKNGSKIYYNYLNQNSKKTPILFIHSFAMNWTCFRGEINKFKKKDYPVIYFDLPGHGKSSTPQEYKKYNFKNISQIIKQLLDSLNVKRVICVGYSMGGMIAIKFTTNNKQYVSKLIILNSANKYPDTFKIFKKFKGTHLFKNTFDIFSKNQTKRSTKQNKQDIDMLQAELNSKNISTFFLKNVFRMSSRSVFYFIDVIFNTNLRNLNKIECPVLVLHPKKDQFFSNKEDLNFSKKIKNAVYKNVNGGHDNVIINSNLIFKEINKFIHNTDKNFLKKQSKPN